MAIYWYSILLISCSFTITQNMPTLDQRQSVADLEQNNHSTFTQIDDFQVVRNDQGVLSLVTVNPENYTNDEVSRMKTAEGSTIRDSMMFEETDDESYFGEDNDWAFSWPSLEMPTNELSNTSSTFVPSQCTNGRTLCDEPDNYPLAIIEAAIGRESYRLSELFGEDTVGDPEIESRFGGGMEQPLCNSVRQVLYPKTGLTKDNEWLYIVNSDKYQQGVLVEQCIDTNVSCGFSNGFRSNMKSSCEQAYIYRLLLAIHNDGTTKKQMFQIPSCCQCVVTKI